MQTREERDTMGVVEVPAEALWGAQTQRSLQNFKISSERMPVALIHALARVKRAAAKVNHDLGLLNAAMENWDAAAQYYERLFAIRPSSATAAQLARVYHRKGDEAKESEYRTACVSLLLNV